MASGIGTPAVDNNNKNTEHPSADSIPEEEREDYSESESGANGDKLEQAIEDLMQAEQNGHIEIDDALIIIHYINSRLAQGLKRKDLAKRISCSSQWTFIIRSARNNKKQQAGKSIDEDFLQMSGSRAKLFKKWLEMRE